MQAASLKTHTSLSTEQRNQLKIDSLALGEYETTYDVKCPSCGQDKSFAVTRTETGVLYKCHRNKCGIEGFVPSIAASAYNAAAESKKEFKPKPYKGDLSDIPQEVYNVLLEKYELTKGMIDAQGWKYDAPNHRIMCRMRNLYGYEAGWISKSLPGSPYQGPKAVQYWEVDDKVRLHFPKVELRAQNTVLVCEDVISALKLSAFTYSCALMGTGMNVKQAAFLAHNFRNCIMILDPDAVAKSMAYLKRYGSLFTTFKIKCLNKDPKDTSYQTIADMLGDM